MTEHAQITLCHQSSRRSSPAVSQVAAGADHAADSKKTRATGAGAGAVGFSFRGRAAGVSLGGRAGAERSEVTA